MERLVHVHVRLGQVAVASRKVNLALDVEQSHQIQCYNTSFSRINAVIVVDLHEMAELTLK